MPMTVRLRTSRRVLASSLSRSGSSNRGSFGFSAVQRAQPELHLCSRRPFELTYDLAFVRRNVRAHAHHGEITDLPPAVREHLEPDRLVGLGSLGATTRGVSANRSSCFDAGFFMAVAHLDRRGGQGRLP
jgi:hypothetical protein